MPATGLKIFGTGACLPWCSISSVFQNSLKNYGHRGYEFLEFWCWNLVPFLPDIGFQLLKSSWSSLTHFSFNDEPNVLYRWKFCTAGRLIQDPDSSTTKLCCCNSWLSFWWHPSTAEDPLVSKWCNAKTIFFLDGLRMSLVSGNYSFNLLLACSYSNIDWKICALKKYIYLITKNNIYI